jgi:hypothetical protein
MLGVGSTAPLHLHLICVGRIRVSSIVRLYSDILLLHKDAPSLSQVLIKKYGNVLESVRRCLKEQEPSTENSDMYTICGALAC